MSRARATPTIDGDHVYTLGAEGDLFCLKLSNGDVVWHKPLKETYRLEKAPHWGYASHPLVDGDTLYVVGGNKEGVALALDKMTGEQKWQALPANDLGYCPPLMIEAGGTKQLIIWHPESINAVNPETGEVYWSFEISPNYKMSIIAPIQYDDYLFASALQGTSILLRLDRDQPKAEEVWRNKGIHSDHNPPLIVDGKIYGVAERGKLKCFDLLTGEEDWSDLATTAAGRPMNATTGFIVKNNDHYYISNEVGELIIGKLNPDGFTEIDRAKMLEPTGRTSNRNVVWSHPAFARKCVFARNDKEVVCISLAASGDDSNE